MRARLYMSACCSLALLGCPPPVTDPSSPEAARCGLEAMIENAEDTNNQVMVQDGRSGYIYTYVDREGSTIAPTAGEQGGVFEVSPRGPSGSGHALRMHGSIGKASIVYAGMGLNFVDPKGPYDASKYKGITFWAKKTRERWPGCV